METQGYVLSIRLMHTGASPPFPIKKGLQVGVKRWELKCGQCTAQFNAPAPPVNDSSTVQDC